jgi:subtilase family serine protease
MHLPKFPGSVATTSLLALASLASSTAVAATPAHTVPNSVLVSNDHGRLNPATALNVTVHLKPQNEAEFKKVVDALYDPSSPTYHHWLSDDELKKYAPTADQVAAVSKELAAHGLTVVSVDGNGLSVRAHGTAANVESAFGTEIHEFEHKGEVFRANVKDFRLAGPAGDYVSSVGGIESHLVKPLFKRVINVKTGKPYAAIPLKKVQDSGGVLGQYITDQAITAPQNFVFDTPGAALPVGNYYGNVYANDPNLVVDFTPQQLQAVYGLPAVYSAGLSGQGQTIVLLEAYGYPTMMHDANAFFSLTGLPLLDSSNFSVIYPEGPPLDPTAGILTGWDGEIALDIQWAHTIAPKAKIVVVASAGQLGEDFQQGMQYIVDHKLGYQVSDSWEEDTDLIAGPAEDESYESILIQAAAKGISFQFSTGDGADEGLGTPVGAAGVPSNAPHGTAVGGTAILNFGSGFRTLGWGDSITYVAADGPFDPPAGLGNIAGSGGGESVYFPRPSWQKGLPGTGRQTPDVSALADPYTGVPIVLTVNGQQELDLGIGGTSLASPIFTAFWALANQSSLHPLGQAAPRIAALTSSQIADVLPLTEPTSVSGSVTDENGTTNYGIYDLFKGQLYHTVGFTSAMWDLGEGEFVDFGFGLDASLSVTKGWDNVTGYGTPYGMAFIKGVVGNQ